jgi:hypothetical protein
MPKIVDYPRASLKASLDLADAVDSLGGTTSVDMAAERQGKKVGGAFQAIIGAAVKYGLLDSKSQKLSVTKLYKDYKLAYTEEEAQQHLRKALLSAPLFRAIYDRFIGRELPVAHFEKLLIREFEVPQDIASRVGSYFLDGTSQVGLLAPDNKLIGDGDSVVEPAEKPALLEDNPSTPNLSAAPLAERNTVIEQPEQPPALQNETKHYTVRISGPGMNTSIEVRESDDLLIVEAILKKVERALKNNERTD